MKINIIGRSSLVKCQETEKVVINSKLNNKLTIGISDKIVMSYYEKKNLRYDNWNIKLLNYFSAVFLIWIYFFRLIIRHLFINIIRFIINVSQ